MPLLDRDDIPENYDQKLKELRRMHPDRYKHALKDCTFSPNINPRSKAEDRTVDDLLSWGKDRQFKLANARLNELDLGQQTFTPEIDPNSRRLAGIRDGEVEDRLMNSGIDRAQRLKDKSRDEKLRMFHPKISDNSRKLAAGLRLTDDLRKIDNGQTINLDFWEALPPGVKNGDQLLLRPPKNAKIGKVRRRDADKSRSRSMNARSGAGRSKSRNARNKDFNPEYTSPYTKELLASDIPLKTIINRTGKFNKKRAAEKRGPGGKKTARSKAGRSRSKSRARKSTKAGTASRGAQGSKSTIGGAFEVSEFAAGHRYRSKSRSGRSKSRSKSRQRSKSNTRYRLAGSSPYSKKAMNGRKSARMSKMTDKFYSNRSYKGNQNRDVLLDQALTKMRKNKNHFLMSTRDDLEEGGSHFIPLKVKSSLDKRWGIIGKAGRTSFGYRSTQMWEHEDHGEGPRKNTYEVGNRYMYESFKNLKTGAGDGNDGVGQAYGGAAGQGRSLGFSRVHIDSGLDGRPQIK